VQPGGRLESIQIMRGLAALSVLFFHIFENDNFISQAPRVSALFSKANLGVLAFFVISGFVIPLTMRQMRYEFRRDALLFLARRLIRLEPPYILSVFLAAAIAYIASRMPAYRGAPPPLDLSTLGAQFVYVAPWVHKPWINGVAWTLAIEFQYYILMLFIAPALLSGKRGTLLCFFAAIALAAIISNDQRVVLPYLPYFALGFIAFLRYERRVDDAVFISGVLLFGALAWRAYDYRAAAICVATCFLIFVPLRGPVRGLSFLGTISYSLYLVHDPISERLINLAARFGVITMYVAAIAAIACSLAFASLFWYFVERPSMQTAKRVTSRGPQIRYGSVPAQ
jgi:peptidoglycan/LPS O-acetylase OafA/YrhL